MPQPAAEPPAAEPSSTEPSGDASQPGAEPARSDSRAEQRRRTEARILAAAAELFVASGYERTTVRAIAQAAGVDGGLVMHYFGSKQELFERVTHGAGPLPELSGPPSQVAEQVLAQLADSLETEPVQSLAVLRSMLTHPEAANRLGERTLRYRAQLASAIPAPDADLRAALISAIILGVAVDRHLLKTGGLDSATPDEIIRLLRPVVHILTTSEPGRPAPEPGRPTPER
ncbi:MAG TPA: TetR family transcriptional regulator [Streptosporangiaceae bacterium]|nr:TetR family transcriptional regulator [Streptosporangiaceae bacterium]